MIQVYYFISLTCHHCENDIKNSLVDVYIDCFLQPLFSTTYPTPPSNIPSVILSPPHSLCDQPTHHVTLDSPCDTGQLTMWHLCDTRQLTMWHSCDTRQLTMCHQTASHPTMLYQIRYHHVMLCIIDVSPCVTMHLNLNHSNSLTMAPCCFVPLDHINMRYEIWNINMRR